MKHFVLNITAILLIAVLCAAFSFPAGAVSDTLPAPFFDLEFDEYGNLYDSAEHYDVVMFGGGVKTVDVNIGETAYKATGFRCEKPTEFIELDMLPSAGISSEDEFGKMLLGGCAFEIVIQTDEPAGGSCALFGSCNGGGVMLYTRKGNSTGFQIGSDGGKETGGAENGNANYSYSGPINTEATVFPAGQLTHIVGVYDNLAGMLRLYINGNLLQESNYGTAPFKIGKAYYDVLGIGLNPSYTSEEIGKYTPYTVLDARIFNSALSENQVMDAYNDLQLNVLSGAAAFEIKETTAPATTEAPVTEPPVTEAPKTEAPAATEAPKTEAPATQAPSATDKPAEKSGCGSAVMCVGSILILLPAAILLRRKHSRD